MKKINLKKQTIFSLLGILVVVASIPMAVLLVKQRQEIRKEAALTDDSRCAAIGGSCRYTSTGCGENNDGTFKAGYCSGPADRQCCVPPPKTSTSTGDDSRCAAIGGSCRYTSTGCGENNDGTFKAGYCSGPADRQCCVPPPKTSTSTGDDSGCTNQGGSCKYTSESCSGTFKPGYCTGPTNRQCCIPSSKTGGTVDGNTNVENAWGKPVWGLYQTGKTCSAPPPPTPTPTPPRTNTPTPTPPRTVTPTPTNTPTLTPTPTSTLTPTPTPTVTVGCNQSCTTNSNCQDDLICSNGYCRNKDCTAEIDCNCPGPTPTPTNTPTPTPTTTTTPGVTSTPTPTTTPGLTPTPTPTTTPSELAQVTPTVALPEAGFALPTFGAIIAGFLLVVVSLAFLL